MKLIIQESIESYPGNCPCPYNYASNGSSCGKRSAYSREGGEAPLCYARDVTTELIAEYRAREGYARETPRESKTARSRSGARRK